MKGRSSVSTWGSFLYSAWALVGLQNVLATSSTTSSSTYLGCSGYPPFINDSVCDELNNNPECGYDGGDCCPCTCVDSLTKSCGYDADFNCTDPSVPDDCGETPSPAAAFGFPNCTGYIWDLGNELCDDDLNNEECGYDGGDCCRCTCRSTYYDYCGHDGYDCLDPNAPTDCDTAGPTPSPAAAFGYPDCTGHIYFIQDGYCDSSLNNEECGYDGGDCCMCTCQDGVDYNCGVNSYDCLDPDAPTDCDTASPTPSPAAAFGFPDCTGDMNNYQTGYCTSSLNNEECGYDGGDCCMCTCQDGGNNICGVNGYDCLDPDAPTDCDTASPTPSPAAAFGFPDCTGNMNNYQTGYCTSSLNNEECGYDGGDCCRCTCEDSSSTCGSNGYNCLDPNADTDCPTPSPTPTPATGLGYPDCTGDMSDLQNGYCDWDLNNEECGYDGGDCCSCTCEDGLYTCDDDDFNCLDPDVDCPSPSPTPTPAAGLGYPDCIGDMSDLHNGYCDWDLNNEECGYDGGDCCECSCTASSSGYDCGEGGYYCLEPDPCPSPSPSPSAEMSIRDIIVMAAIIFIGCLCVICAGCFVVVYMRAKKRVKTAGMGLTAHTTSVSNPQQSAPHMTINNPAGQQRTVAHPVGSANPSRQAGQSGHSPRAVMPWGKREPPDTLGQRFARVAPSRCAPVPEGSALERSSSMVVVGHRPNSDTIEAKRIRLAVAESVRVQTISEAILRQKSCLPQSVGYAAITGTGGENPSEIVNNVNAEEKLPSDADKTNSGQDELSGSEWGSDGEVRMEEKTQQDDRDEFSTEHDQQPDTGETYGDTEITGPMGKDKDSLSGITNDAYIEENSSRHPHEGDNAGSVSECIGDGEGGIEEDGCQDAKTPCAGANQVTGTNVGDKADEQEGIVVPMVPACEEDADNTPQRGTRAEPSDNEG